MKKINKVLQSLMLVFVMLLGAFAFVACGGNNDYTDAVAYITDRANDEIDQTYTVTFESENNVIPPRTIVVSRVKTGTDNYVRVHITVGTEIYYFEYGKINGQDYTTREYNLASQTYITETTVKEEFAEEYCSLCGEHYALIPDFVYQQFLQVAQAQTNNTISGSNGTYVVKSEPTAEEVASGDSFGIIELEYKDNLPTKIMYDANEVKMTATFQYGTQAKVPENLSQFHEEAQN